jgi:hypothetical protein
MEEKCFGNDVIVDAKELVSEYRFRLEGISTPIVLRVYKNLKTGQFVCVQSHFIKTPLQASAYVTDRPRDDKREWLVYRIVNDFIQRYKEAVSQGYKPSDSWLVENKHFK